MSKEESTTSKGVASRMDQLKFEPRQDQDYQPQPIMIPIYLLRTGTIALLY